jgi:hypothetical protein
MLDNGEGVFSRTRSDPSARATYSKPGPESPVTLRSNASRVPSRDQRGLMSVSGPVTIAVDLPLAGSTV